MNFFGWFSWNTHIKSYFWFESNKLIKYQIIEKKDRNLHIYWNLEFEYFLMTSDFIYKTGHMLITVLLFVFPFFQFLLIFRKAAAGELEEGSGLLELYSNISEIDVDKEGVKGAKNFFQTKVSKLIIIMIKILFFSFSLPLFFL